MKSRISILGVIGLIILALLILAPLYVLKKQSSIYPYPVTKDYEYSFQSTQATISDVTIKGGRFRLDNIEDPRQSAFLKVKVHTGILDKLLQPGIKLSGGGISSTEYFEHGADGIRYLNLTPFVTKGISNIVLKEKHISVADQTAQLILFKNQDVKSKKILIIAPHPDDAEIAAFGLYSSNPRTYIVTVTAGDAGASLYGKLYKNPVQDFIKKGELRTWNSITVPLLGGIPPEQSLNLGFFDGTLETMFIRPTISSKGLYTGISDISAFRKLNISPLAAGLSGQSDWNSLVDNLAYLLGEIRPDIVVTPYPALDEHPDHKLSSLALFEAIKKSGIHEGHLYLYTNHFVLNEFFPYGKAGSMISLPPNFNDKMYFDSIYSHALSDENQNDKVLALEAMNDLRPGLEWRTTKGALNLFLHNLERDIFNRENSYYKRAIRNNELFFIVKINDLYNEDKLQIIKGNIH